MQDGILPRFEEKRDESLNEIQILLRLERGERMERPDECTDQM